MSHSSGTSSSNHSTPDMDTAMEDSTVIANGIYADHSSTSDQEQDLESTVSASETHSDHSSTSSHAFHQREQDSDDSHAFNQRVQDLLVCLEDEIGVDLLLMSGDHDNPEVLAVKNIWLERRIQGLRDEMERVRGANVRRE